MVILFLSTTEAPYPEEGPTKMENYANYLFGDKLLPMDAKNRNRSNLFLKMKCYLNHQKYYEDTANSEFVAFTPYLRKSQEMNEMLAHFDVENLYPNSCDEHDVDKRYGKFPRVSHVPLGGENIYNSSQYVFQFESKQQIELNRYTRVVNSVEDVGMHNRYIARNVRRIATVNILVKKVNKYVAQHIFEFMERKISLTCRKKSFTEVQQLVPLAMEKQDMCYYYSNNCFKSFPELEVKKMDVGHTNLDYSFSLEDEY